MLFLELPSGGLADALGRKPVLLLASAFSMAATGVLLVADTVALLAVACALQGIFRALDSGPLQAWFIDASLEADPGVDIPRALAHSDVVICSAIGLGALLGGGDRRHGRAPRHRCARRAAGARPRRPGGRLLVAVVTDGRDAPRPRLHVGDRRSPRDVPAVDARRRRG